jgi:hypothetical protein
MPNAEPDEEHHYGLMEKASSLLFAYGRLALSADTAG